LRIKFYTFRGRKFEDASHTIKFFHVLEVFLNREVVRAGTRARESVPEWSTIQGSKLQTFMRNASKNVAVRARGAVTDANRRRDKFGTFTADRGGVGCSMKGRLI